MVPEMTNDTTTSGFDYSGCVTVIAGDMMIIDWGYDYPSTTTQWIPIYAPDPTPQQIEDYNPFRCWLNCGACGNMACHRELSKAGLPEYQSRVRPKRLPRMKWTMKGARI